MIRRPHTRAVLSATLALVLASSAGAPPAPSIDLPGVDPELLTGFRPVHTAIGEGDRRSGYIDWSARRIVAVGRAMQRGRGVNAALRARRAAEVIALRNVLASALGVRIGVNGRIGALRRGEISLQGRLKDFKIARTYSKRVGGETAWYAEVHVPLFGVANVAGRLFDEQLQAHRLLVRRRTRARWAAPAGGDALGGEVLVIDARGLGFAPSVYPLVVTSDKRILIDMETVPRRVAVARGPCAYAAGELEPDEPRSRRPAGPDVNPCLSWPGGPECLAFVWPAVPAATAPASRPTTRPRRRRPRFVIRARQAEGKEKSVLVVSGKDALKLLADPQAAGLARGGRVLVVIDAAAAGLEGRRRPPAGGDRVAAGP